MLGFFPIASVPLSTASFIISVAYNYRLPLEIQLAQNLNIKTLDWILSMREADWIASMRGADWTVPTQETAWTVSMQETAWIVLVQETAWKLDAESSI